MMTHCWEDGPRRVVLDETGYPHAEVGSTCLLELGHDGAHEWTDDDAFGVSFAAADAQSGGGQETP